MTNPSIDIRAMAQLARLDVSDAEVERLEKEVPGILAFVETIQKVGGTADASTPSLRNVMRDDIPSHESGVHTETLLKAAPQREGDRISVKQVVSRKK